MKIALVGSAPSSVKLAPYKDASYQEYMGGKTQIQPPTPHIKERWQIWACSPGAYGQVERADAWFELHRWEPGQSWLSPEYCQWLRQFNGPVYTGGPVPEIASHIVYPVDEIVIEFGAYFLTSSLSLMFALAIYKMKQIDDQNKALGHPPEQHTIGMWGVDMAATEEYGYQRAGCQFFIMEALRRGIEVFIPEESDILRPMPVYGVCEWDHEWIKSTARLRELKQRKESYLAAVQGNQQGEVFMRGAIENQEYMMNTWSSPYGLEAGKYLKNDIDRAGVAAVGRITWADTTGDINQKLEHALREQATPFGHARIKKQPTD